MSKLTVELPDSLLVAVKQLAGYDDNSINQFIALTTEKYSQERASHASKAKFEAVLANVPDVEAKAFDKP